MESLKLHAYQSDAQRPSPADSDVHDAATSAAGGKTQCKRKRMQSLPEPRVFSQKTSSRTNGFLKKNEAIIGEAAVRKLQSGMVPSANEIRAAAIKSDLTHRGAGLHEVVVTNFRSDIAKNPDENVRSMAAQAQSGLRLSTALTLLRSPEKGASIGGHTGALLSSPSASARFVCLAGQAKAHDVLRQAFQDAIELPDLKDTEFLVSMANAQLSIMPPGIDVLREPALEGVVPNLIVADGKAMGPASEAKKGGTGAREEFIKIYDVGREIFKDRTRAVKRSIDGEVARVASPSPERKAYDGSPSSGNYIEGPVPRALPQIPAVAADFKTAHLGAWMTESMRLERSLRSSAP